MGTATGVSDGVAVWAHLGGFITGFAILLMLRPFIPRRSLSQPRRRGVDVW
jgi:membrane associated rhomboid family serine protease